MSWIHEPRAPPSVEAALPRGGLNDRLRALRRLPVTTDAAPDLDAVVALARSYHLSIYNAVYLELARRHRAALATVDVGLAHAATAEDVPIVD